MTNIDKVVVTTRLDLMVKYLQTLKDYEDISLEEYLKNFQEQLIVERLLQLMIQAATDINNHLLSRLNQSTIDYHFAFIELSRCGILTSDLAIQLAKSAGLRNRLVRGYHEIDPTLIFMSIHLALQYYPHYVRQINTYLTSLDVEDC